MIDLQIVDLASAAPNAIEEAAGLLNRVFPSLWPGSWQTMEEARAEVEDMLLPDRISRVAMVEDEVAGWIGGIPEYDGNVWELHPLVVNPTWQRQGIGAALVRDLEAQARARGGLTVMLGTDDVDGSTTLAAADLYDELWRHLRDAQVLGRHPVAFYQRLGYTIIGVMPDANGRGKPDIYMAKRIA